MFSEFLYGIDLWLIFFVLVFALLAASEICFRFGRKCEKKKEVNELLPTSILGLLALLLGFTFSMAISRFDARKNLVMQEANAIGTAYLRADLLPEKDRGDARQILKDYTQHRLQFFVHLRTGTTEYLQRTQDLQTRLWKLTADIAQKQRDPITGLFVQAVNEVIDTDGERVYATENHVPEIVYIVIFLITLLGVGSLSYVVGARGQGRRSLIFLSLLFPVVITLIQDLDRPGRGLIRVSEDSLIVLNQSMERGP